MVATGDRMRRSDARMMQIVYHAALAGVMDAV